MSDSHKAKKPLQKGLTRSMGHEHRQVWKDKAEPEGKPLTVEEHRAIMRAESEAPRLENKRLLEEHHAYEARVRASSLNRQPLAS